jgi:soluble lytic murein transglycosylase-like protein
MGTPQIIVLVVMALSMLDAFMEAERGLGKDSSAYRLMKTLGLAVLLTWGGFFSSPAQAQVPADAQHYRLDLVRNARMIWGLDAPVAVFAAQIHQESGWRADAKSPVGAVGMAQFMPATAQWIRGAYPTLGGADAAPTNPVWAIRALVTYDRHLWQRIPVADRCGRMWATLRSYNGGLGHWLAEARNARESTIDGIDAACGSARRSVKHCRENLGYPRRILVTLQPRYAAWGPGVACGAET